MTQTCTAFTGTRRIASGGVLHVAGEAKAAVDRGETVLIFDDATAQPVEIDFRGSTADVRRRIGEAAPELDTKSETESGEPRGPGRPKLGVVAREVTLLPRHWEWLGTQPGGASVALRKLVEEARRANDGKDRTRRAREVAYRFMSAMAGNLPNFEEAARALFAGDAARFGEMIARWPKDVKGYARTLASEGLR